MPNNPPRALTPLQQDNRRKKAYLTLANDFGGEAALSTLQRALLRQAAILLLRVELAEIAIARGEPHDEARFASDVALSLRVLSRLGARAAATKADAPLTLAEYLAERAAEPVERVEPAQHHQEIALGEQVALAGPVAAGAPDLLAQRDLLVAAPAPATPPDGATTPAVAIRDLSRSPRAPGKTFVELLEERRVARLAAAKP